MLGMLEEGMLTKMMCERMTLVRMIGESMMKKGLGMGRRVTLEMMMKEGIPWSGWWDV